MEDDFTKMSVKALKAELVFWQDEERSDARQGFEEGVEFDRRNIQAISRELANRG